MPDSEELRKKPSELREEHGCHRSSGSWRSRVAAVGRSLRIAWRIWRQYGFGMLWRKAYLKSFRLRIRALSPAAYLRRTGPSKRELARQRQAGVELADKIRFAVVAPPSAGAADVTLLRRALERQTFGGWTLLPPERIGTTPVAAPGGGCGFTHLIFPAAGTVPYPQALFALAEYFVRTPGAELVYADDAWYETAPDRPYFIHGKPDFSEIALCGGNYIGSSWCVSRKLAELSGIGDGTFASLFRAIECAGTVAHLPEVLFACRGRRAAGDPLVARRIDAAAEKAAIDGHLRRIGRPGHAEQSGRLPFFRIRRTPEGTPLVSILIPSRDHAEVLRRCVSSIVDRSTWRDLEIVILENGSREPDTERLYRELSASGRVRVVHCPDEETFNYSRINNFGAEQCRGEYLVFMNNDIEVVTPSWIEEMLVFAQRPEVGAVGAKLRFPDGTIQHGGVLVGFSGAADHLFLGADGKAPGYAGWLLFARDCSAVTFACCMVRREVWERSGGLDESFAVSFNDVDFCLKLAAAGYHVVWTPFAELYHHESLSRGYDVSAAQYRRARSEIALLRNRWAGVFDAGDPFYSVHLSLLATDCRLRHPPERRLLAAVSAADDLPR